jgi:hypothetical protein
MPGHPEKLKGKGFDKFPEHINKKGRPKGKSISTILKELLDKEAPDCVITNKYVEETIKKIKPGYKPTNAEVLAFKVLHSAQALGDMKAVDTILERTEGKVSQPLEGNGIIEIFIGKQPNKKK